MKYLLSFDILRFCGSIFNEGHGTTSNPYESVRLDFGGLLGFEIFRPAPDIQLTPLSTLARTPE
jgi:hypothetical protein